MIIAELPDLLTRLRGQIQAAEADTPSGYIAVVEMRAAEMAAPSLFETHMERGCPGCPNYALLGKACGYWERTGKASPAECELAKEVVS